MISWILDEEMPVPEGNNPAFLNTIELEKLAGKRFPKRRMEWLHGRWVAKQLLQRQHPACRGCSLSEILIQNETSGLPYASLADGSRLPGSLSITHSGPLAASALVLDAKCEVGIDLEKIEPRPAGIFETYFTRHEIAYIHTLSPDDLPKVITLIWSAKEAVLKALGAGLSMDTRRIEISFSGSEDPKAAQGGWQKFEVALQDLTKPGADNLTGVGLNWDGWRQTYHEFILTIAVSRPTPAPPCREGLWVGGEIPLQVI